MEQKYAAFISYRHRELDSAVAKALHSRIEQYVIPRELRKNGKKLGRVFRDVEELPVSSDLSEDICRALDSSEYLVVVCSPSAVQSPWVLREVTYFLSGHDREKVFTVLVEGEPGEAFPPMLTRVENPDGTVTEVEPLAVDVRAESPAASVKRLRREIPRLFAAMIGCPYDALVMREQRRARRRVTAAAAGILAVALAFTSLVLVKNREIDGKNQELEARNEEIDRQNEELEAQNEELERQKREVQLRESELLTAEAFSALAAGDRGAALTDALAALTSEDGDRPYYAPAEAALISALGLFEDGLDCLVVETVLEQNTPILDFCVSSDGSRIATLDTYGLLTCYDSRTGEVLWNCLSGATSGVYTAPGDVIFAVGHKSAGVSFETGEQLWTWTADGASIWYLGTGEDASLAAFLVSRLSDDLSMEEMTVAVIRTDDGTVVQEAALGQHASGIAGDMFPQLSFPAQFTGTGASVTADFSADNRRFAGVYSMTLSEEEEYICLFTLDLETGALTVHAEIPVTPGNNSDVVYYLGFCDEDSALLMLRHSQEMCSPGILEKYDLTENKLLWQTEHTDPELDFVWMTTQRLMEEKDGFIALACGEMLMAFDGETGAAERSLIFPREICLLEVPQYPFFRVVLEDGSFGYGWLNSSGSLIPSLDANVGECVSARTWNGSFLELMLSEGYVEGTRVTDAGFAVTVPDSSLLRLAVKRAVVPAEHFSFTHAEFLDEDDAGYSAGVWMCGDRIAIGPVEDGDSGAFPEKVLLMDPEDPEDILVLPCPDDLYYMDRILVLQDLSGFLLCGEDGDIVCYRADGSKEILSVRESIELSSYVDVYSFVASKYQSSANVLREDGSVICARVGEELCIWIDGELTVTEPAPEGTQFQVVTEFTVEDLVLAGSNGYVLTGLYSDTQDAVTDAFGLYHVKTGTWTMLKPEGAALEACTVAMSGVSSRVAVADDEGTLFVCDAATGETLTSFPLLLPQESVSQLIFLREDGFLCVITEDGQIRVYDIATGEVVFREQREGSSYLTYSVTEAADGGRIYFSRDGDGFVLESEGWTKLTELPDLRCYDPQRDMLIRMTYDKETWDDLLEFVRLPDTQELIGIAQALLR